VIEDDVFVGSDTQFIAPVTVGRGTTIGAGSTITRNTPPGELTLSRSKQFRCPAGSDRSRNNDEDGSGFVPVFRFPATPSSVFLRPSSRVQ